MSNLVQRILVALVAIPLIVALSMLGGWYFFGFVLLIATLGLHEFYLLMRVKGLHPHSTLGIVFGTMILIVFFWEKYRLFAAMAFGELGGRVHEANMLHALVPLSLVFVFVVLCVELFRGHGSAVMNAAVTVFGAMYVSMFLGSFIGLRELFASQQIAHGAHLAATEQYNEADLYRWGGLTIVSVFVSLWMCDSLAYFAGRFFGKHKLFERVSPNKTWEGAIAGYVGGVATFLLAQNFLLPYMSVGSAFVCGSIVGVFGQIGDLVESLIKRDAAVKDSSSLIPGHGGVLDRFDSLMFVAPLMYLYIRWIVS
ncbi:MAG: hypothetical protein C4326_10840 [Ignavibacteria bacterium]